MKASYLAAAVLCIFSGFAAGVEASATLSVNTETLNHSRTERDYLRTRFDIGTGVRHYRLEYKSFIGDDAALNVQDRLSDQRSGYGMLVPHTFWYHHGLLDVYLATEVERLDIRLLQGDVRVLAEAGPVVGYDLVFTGKKGARIIIRTLALAGREEIFLAVYAVTGDGQDGVLRANFRCYPCGYKAPRDRWVHTAIRAIRNAGAGERAEVALGPDDGGWMLAADHLTCSDDEEGLLGLAFDSGLTEKISVIHNRNYAVDINARGRADRGLHFVLYTFKAMDRRSAWEMLEGDSARENLMEKAFGYFPVPE